MLHDDEHQTELGTGHPAELVDDYRKSLGPYLACDQGTYIRLNSRLLNSPEVKALQKATGHKGVHQFIALLCIMLDKGGSLKTEQRALREALAEELWFQSEEEFCEYVDLLVALTLIFARRDPNNTLVEISNPWIIDQVDRYMQRKSNGKKGGRPPKSTTQTKA